MRKCKNIFGGMVVVEKKLFTELLLLLTSKVATIAMESTHHEARMGGLGM
jgi:hypothetical protein